MNHRSSWGGLAAAILSTAAAAGAAAWGDAIRVSIGAVPTVPWSERAALAARGGALLVVPLLATLLLVWAASAIGSWRRAHRRDRGAGVAVSVPVARVPGALAGAVLAGWIVALAILAVSGFSIKTGWIAGAAVAGAGAGWFLARRISRRAAAHRVRPNRTVAAASAAAAGLLWGSAFLPSLEVTGGPLPASTTKEGPPGILLVVVDALRADHLGAYGYTERPTSPHIDRFSAAAVRFDDVIAPSSWTLPAMASIMTSLMPGQSGVADTSDALPREADDLATRLARAGYTTAAFSTNPWLKRSFGFDDGFGAYYDMDRLGLARRLLGVRLKNLALRRIRRIRLDPELVPRAHEVTERSLRWLRRHADKPFFLYLHYMDVHAPYDPVEPFHGIFCAGHRFDRPDHLLESRFRAGKYKGDAAVLEHVEELYDEDIAATDDAIGRLLSGMEAIGLASRTAVILVADHGEEFYEHGGTTHGRTLYQEVLRVPLIAAPPGWSLQEAAQGGGAGRGRVARGRASALDVYPTILDLARAEAPEGITGVSLAPMIRGSVGEGAAGGGADRVVGAQLFLDGRSWSALYAGHDKIVRGRPPAADPTAASVVEVYHLDRDPAERTSVTAGEPERAAGLASVLNGLEKVWGVAGIGGRGAREKIDAETLKQLKALGYVN